VGSSDVGRLSLSLLNDGHKVDGFDCKHSTNLNEWLKLRALNNQQRDLSRVFVLACPEGIVRAYFSLSGHHLERGQLTAKDKRGVNVPIVPAQLLGRFATDVSIKGQEAGILLMDLVFEKYLQILERTTCGYLCLDAKNDFLVNYYRDQFGFKASSQQSEDGATFMYLKTSAIRERFAQGNAEADPFESGEADFEPQKASA
jgi:hypothetical protein